MSATVRKIGATGSFAGSGAAPAADTFGEVATGSAPLLVAAAACSTVGGSEGDEVTGEVPVLETASARPEVASRRSGVRCANGSADGRPAGACVAALVFPVVPTIDGTVLLAWLAGAASAGGVAALSAGVR
ncbi:MAG: hypothetical protein ABI305_08305 [Tepidiformaceae bacterium]